LDVILAATVCPGIFEITADALAVHPLASVTTIVYDPAARFDAVLPVPPEGLHAYV
jgi:hypothetical protein